MKIGKLTEFNENTYSSLKYFLKAHNCLSCCLNFLFNFAFIVIKRIKRWSRKSSEKKLQNKIKMYKQCQKKIFYSDDKLVQARTVQDLLKRAGIEAELVKEIKKDCALYFIVEAAETYPDQYILMTTESLNVVEKSIAMACQNLETLESYKSRGIIFSKLFFCPISVFHSTDDFYFYRLLLAFEIISFETFFQLTSSFFSFKNSKGVCLSLIESSERRNYFKSINKYGFDFFDGLRHQEGWIGCGLSYKFLIRLAQRDSMHLITILEDDVILEENFRERYEEIMSFLSSRDDWDIFSGLMAYVSPELKVWGATTLSRNFQIVFTNQLVSTVFNIYSKKTFEYILKWDEHSYNKETNQIDQYLRKKANARYVTMIPFLVGHNELLNSLVNSSVADRYEEMIELAELKLRKLVRFQRLS